MSENIAKSFLGGYFFYSPCRCFYLSLALLLWCR